MDQLKALLTLDPVWHSTVSIQDFDEWRHKDVDFKNRIVEEWNKIKEKFLFEHILFGDIQ